MPKPFMRLADDQSLLQKTFLRIAGLPDVARLLTVTNRDLLFRTLDDYRAVNRSGLAQDLLLEPMGRNTAPAIAAAALHVQEHFGDQAQLLILPADHLIRDEQAFAAAVAEARGLAAQGYLVTFGITPERAETGFGYIEQGAPLGNGFRVARFVEKPDQATAQSYLDSGKYLWNAGMFCFQAATVLQELERHAPEVLIAARAALAVQAHALQDQLVAHSGLHLSILDSRSGQPLMSFGDQAAASVAANRALLARLQADARQPVFQSWSTGNDQRLLSIGASMRMKNGTPVQVLLSSERNADERLLDGFLRATLLALPFLLPLIALAAWWVVRAGLEPLNRFRRVAAQVSPQDLSYRIPEQNLPRELDSLARSFNHMLGRLEDGVRQLSQFSDDLAHELRAPICNLLVRNQVLLSQHRDGAAYREALESNAEELERLSRIVTDMLFLVQVDNPAIQAQFGCVALHEQAAKVIDLYEMVAEDKGVELRLSGNGFAHGDNLMIQRAISNLVSNAVRHTPQGGRIDVRIGERAGHTEVRVSNDGPGIPPEYLPHLFERFYRRAGRQTGAQAGTGLGLAIVQSIMAYHGGRAEAESVPQQKTHLRLLFPSTGAA
nr:heavy metal sensor histidine kinase [Pseudomonas aeruginosa]